MISDFIESATSKFTCPLVPEITYRSSHIKTMWLDLGKKFGAMGDFPYWAIAWPGSQSLSRYILDNPKLVENKRIIDCGCGNGMAGIAAALSNAHVSAIDIDPFAIAATKINSAENNVVINAYQSDVFDITEQADIFIMGDVFWEEKNNHKVSQWLKAIEQRQAIALFGGDILWSYDLNPQFEKLQQYQIEAIKDIHTATSAIVYKTSSEYFQ